MTLRVLTLTTLFPNVAQTRHGIFVANRLDHLNRLMDVDISVVAPLPWFPGSYYLNAYKHFKSVKENATWKSISVRHPKFLSIPGKGFGLKPKLLAASFLSAIKGESFDIIDSHYAYPDGVAALKVANELGVPIVLSLRGSDINYWGYQKDTKDEIATTLRDVDGIISVSAPLLKSASHIQPELSASCIIENGVDRTLFRPREEIETQQDLILSVGNLIDLKGHHIILEAIRDLPHLKLVIIGSGEKESELKKAIDEWQLDERVKIINNIPQEELAGWYNKAKFTILCSSSEGCPNVVLESIASGTPIIATRVGACEDLIVPNVSGTFIEERTSDGVKVALEKALSLSFDSQKLTECGSKLGWESVVTRQMDFYQSALERFRRGNKRTS